MMHKLPGPMRQGVAPRGSGRRKARKNLWRDAQENGVAGMGAIARRLQSSCKGLESNTFQARGGHTWMRARGPSMVCCHDKGRLAANLRFLSGLASNRGDRLLGLGAH